MYRLENPIDIDVNGFRHPWGWRVRDVNTQEVKDLTNEQVTKLRKNFQLMDNGIRTPMQMTAFSITGNKVSRPITRAELSNLIVYGYNISELDYVYSEDDPDAPDEVLKIQKITDLVNDINLVTNRYKHRELSDSTLHQLRYDLKIIWSDIMANHLEKDLPLFPIGVKKLRIVIPYEGMIRKNVSDEDLESARFHID